MRIGSLPPPKLVSVSPESSLLYARTVMLEKQFSQLAVIDENGTLHGAISWESIGKHTWRPNIRNWQTPSALPRSLIMTRSCLTR